MLSAWLECTTEQERGSLLNMLSQEGFVERGTSGIRLTSKGAIKLADLQARLGETSQGFVAMWFDATMEDAWRLGFEPAIRAAGYTPMRIDKKEHNNKIDDEIIAEIRRSRFLIADFTCGAAVLQNGESTTIARGGVYFEAGFAMGLHIPVIWSCRADQIDEVHFDTRQFSHVVWETTDELRARLYTRISAVIGARPNAPGLK